MYSGAERFYFPFNFDKQHWVGVCVDIKYTTLLVLDSNTAFRSDSQVKKDLFPVAQMFPYVLRQAGVNGTVNDTKPFSMERAKGIPQNGKYTESGVATVLLIQSHAILKIDGCKCIKPELLVVDAQKLAVMLYEQHCQSL